MVGMLFSQSNTPKELHTLAMEAAVGVCYHLLHCSVLTGISVRPSHTVSLDFTIGIAWTHHPLSHVLVTMAWLKYHMGAKPPAPIPVPVISVSLILASLRPCIPVSSISASLCPCVPVSFCFCVLDLSIPVSLHPCVLSLCIPVTLYPCVLVLSIPMYPGALHPCALNPCIPV